VTLSSVDALGNISSSSATVTISSALATNREADGDGATADAQQSLTNPRFRVAKQDTALVAKKAPLGTTFHFTLSAVAQLKIAITRARQDFERNATVSHQTPGLPEHTQALHMYPHRRYADASE
jgi:hypothetical protein